MWPLCNISKQPLTKTFPFRIKDKWRINLLLNENHSGFPVWLFANKLVPVAGLEQDR